ncbi:hypothetical protein PLESTM_001392800 [Pleodorina starrii]|nr:hypothetical protein PLESTM_001392800 [Pleodorina starrii]
MPSAPLFQPEVEEPPAPTRVRVSASASGADKHHHPPSPAAAVDVPDGRTLGSLPSLPKLIPGETVVQLPPADPRVSAAALPPDYNRRALALLVRMAAAVVLFAAAAAAVAAAVVWALGLRTLVVLWVAAEAAFAVYFRQRYSALNAQPLRHAPESHDPLRAFNRLLEISQHSSYVLDVQDYLSCWFCGADPRVIRQDNLADLIAYGFWYKSRQEMEVCGQGPLLRACVARMQSTLGFALPPGHTPGLQVMTHLWEPLRVMYRPVLWYGITEVLAVLCRMVLLALGFKLGTLTTQPTGPMMVAISGDRTGTTTTTNSSSSTRGSSSSSSSSSLGNGSQGGGNNDGGGGGGGTVPVLFLHGVGLGILPYTNLLRCLIAAGLPVVAVQYKHVSMRLCSIIPSADDIAAAVVGLMDELGLGQACVVAHSYGTFVASRLAQKYGLRLQSLVLMDPVCFGMFLPSLLANFIYRPPRTTTIRHWILDYIRAFISRDLHCAAAMCRRFYWSDLNLWPHDVPCRTLISMGGGDELIHVGAVMEFVRHYAAKVLFHPDHSHAQLLIDPAWQQQLVADVLSMASSGVGVAGAREVRRRLTAQLPLQTATPPTLPPPTPTVAAAAPSSPSPPPPPLQRRITVSELRLMLRRQERLQQQQLTDRGLLHPHPLSRRVLDDTAVLGGVVQGPPPPTSAGAVRRRWTDSADCAPGAHTVYDMSGSGGGGGFERCARILEDNGFVSSPSRSLSATHVRELPGVESAAYDIAVPSATADADDNGDDDGTAAMATEEVVAAIAADLRRCLSQHRRSPAAATTSGVLLAVEPSTSSSPASPLSPSPSPSSPRAAVSDGGSDGGGNGGGSGGTSGKEPRAVAEPQQHPQSPAAPVAPAPDGDDDGYDGGGGSDSGKGPRRVQSEPAPPPPLTRFDSAARHGRSRPCPDLWDDARLLLELELTEVGLNRAVLIAGDVVSEDDRSTETAAVAAAAAGAGKAAVGGAAATAMKEEEAEAKAAGASVGRGARLVVEATAEAEAEAGQQGDEM